VRRIATTTRSGSPELNQRRKKPKRTLPASDHGAGRKAVPARSKFISTCIAISTAIGSALRHPSLGSVGFWMVAFYTSVAIGLLVGQILVYRIYRENIIAA
jgi:hypothetical protein